MEVRLKGICKSYEDRAILSSVDLDIPSGGVVVLEGANGTGKTTLMEILAGLIQPDEGEVAIGGSSAAGRESYQRGLFYVPQNVHKFWALQEEPFFCYLPGISVRENLEEGARRDEKKADEFMRLFGLFEVRNTMPAQLSRGQKQRLALARAFLAQQPIVLLDEPLASIDPPSRQDLIETLDYLQRRYSRTMLYVTQHPDELRVLDAHRVSIFAGKLGPGYAAHTTLTGRLIRRAVPQLLSAMAVDTGDKLEAAALAGRRPSDVLEWAASRLRERQERILRQPQIDRLEAARRRLVEFGRRFSANRDSALLEAEVAALRKEVAALSTALTEIQKPLLAGVEEDAALRPLVEKLSRRIDEVRQLTTRGQDGPATLTDKSPGGRASEPVGEGTEPRRIMRRRAAPWISEPLSDKVWRPGAKKDEKPAPKKTTPPPDTEARDSSKSKENLKPSEPHLPEKRTGRRTLILRCPSLMYNYHGIPPFGLATIKAQLEHRGHDIEQDDLDAKCAHSDFFPRHRWGKQFPAKDLMMDIARMRRYWEGRKDDDVTDLMESVLAFTNLEGFDTVALSAVEGDDYAAVMTICMGKYLRQELGKTVILGGEAFPHMQPIKSEIRYFYENGCFDYYIQGYGEVPLLELFDRLDSGKPVGDTPGLVSIDEEDEIIENRPLFTRPEVIPDFSGLPMELYYKKPDEWDIWKDEDEGVEELLVLPLKTNFCCPNKCAFCISSGDNFTKVTWMMPDKIVEAIRDLKERYNTRYFMFADDMFNINARWTEAVADALIEADLDVLWSDCAYARNLTPELLQKLRRSGACRLVWGMETASPRLQEMINKGLEMEELEQVLRWSHDAGIYNALQVIAGLPTETEEEIDMTVEFLRRNQDTIDQVYLNPFSLITGSLMQNCPGEYGLENVKPVATIFQSKPDEVYSWIQRYTFDTKDELGWKDKVKQIEHSFRRIQETMVDLDLGGHDIHTLFLRFARYGEKRFVKDFQSSRKHQGFEYFGEDGERGHSPTGAHI